MSETRPEPYVGQPATIHLWTDSHAAVVLKVSPKSILVARVATGERFLDLASDPGAYGVRPVLAEGILDQITGANERFRRIDSEDGPRYRKGSISVSLGYSRTRIDYRY